MEPDRLGRACAAFGIADPVQIAATPSSHVYKAALPDGTPAALKLLTEAGREEMSGARFMAWRDGRGAARILSLVEDAILIEWLDGPSLGKVVRGGEVTLAIDAIANLLPRLHAPINGPCPPLQPLEDRFGALLGQDLSRVVPRLRADIGRAADVARLCLARSGPPVPLHGDLHHDNIMGQGQDWLAIDAKGVIGCRGYEVANTFGNPMDLPDVTQDPAYHSALAKRFATVLDLPERRIREWAAAHMGLALCWHLESGDGGISEWEQTLPVLLAALETGPATD